MAVISQMACDLILMSCDTVMFWKFRNLSWQDPDQEELSLVTKSSALQEETLEGFFLLLVCYCSYDGIWTANKTVKG